MWPDVVATNHLLQRNVAGRQREHTDIMPDVSKLLSVMSQWNITDKSSYRTFRGLLCFLVFTCAASVDDCPENEYYMEKWCIPCTICEHLNKEELQPCLPQSDAVCGDCFPGYYMDQRYCHSCEYAPADNRYCQLWLASQTTSRPAAGTTISTSTHAQIQHSVVQTTPPSVTEEAPGKPTSRSLYPGEIAAIVVSSLVGLALFIGVLVLVKIYRNNNEEATPIQATGEDQQGHNYT
ncbi:PREDICTED: uncharacterized protein LOC109465762 [Branchiostoma belcheri]|uniref:Uncharacterized protein LOC109465762 n=1 Tax=Branchiostoma belcheri TaxID=7741 RepID=A0A6P4Y2Q2_BRABE|nr:PREDICTED: uncharacterized protein LOC109465762 [Branchiostoma belcheri]